MKYAISNCIKVSSNIVIKESTLPGRGGKILGGNGTAVS